MRTHHQPLARQSNGFSLIELALALTILLIIIPSMLPVYESFVGDIEEQALKQRILEVRRAMQVFYLENKRYPNQLYDQYHNNVDFVVDSRSELVNGIHNGSNGSYPANRRTYLTRLPDDPISGTGDWLLLPMDNDLDGVYNEDPIEATTGTYLGGYTIMPSRMYRGLTTGAVSYDDFNSVDNDRDGRFDEDPIDVGDIRSRSPGYENL